MSTPLTSKKPALQSFLWAAATAPFALAAFLSITLICSGGTPPFRAFYVLAFLVGLVRPWWAIMGIAILGPLSLLEPGKTHRLVQTEAFVLGAIVGYLWTRIRHRDASGGDAERPRERSWFWRCFGTALVVGVLAALVPGLYLTVVTPEEFPANGSGGQWMLIQAFMGYATEIGWPIRSAYNWITGLALAWVAARLATPSRVRALLLLGAFGTVAACFIGVGDFMHLWTLDSWRAPNPDLARMGSHRLVSLAGHSGWLAEWILLTAPGLLLLWEGGRKQKVFALAGFGVVALSLVLTLARIAWIGAGAAAAAGALVLVRERRLDRRWILRAAIGLVILSALAFAISGHELMTRLRHAFDVRDRWNYYISSYQLFLLNPSGIGLGLHSIVYESLFTPFHRFWQYDHATAHSTWLHVFVEQGGWQVIVMGIGVVGVLATAWRGYRRAGEDRERRLLFVLGLVWVGIWMDSLAQYLGYVRVVEVMTWVTAGCILGLAGPLLGPPLGGSQAVADSAALDAGPSKAGRLGRFNGLGVALLVMSIAMAVIAATANYSRCKHMPPPRWIAPDPGNQGLCVWTEDFWRFPIEPEWCGIEFSVLCKHVPQDLVIRPPDNPELRIHMEPGEQRGFWFAFRPSKGAESSSVAQASPPGLASRPRKGSGPFDDLKWLRVNCSTTWRPIDREPGSTDARKLGVYVSGLRPLYCDDDPRRPDTQRWTESSGGMPQ